MADFIVDDIESLAAGIPDFIQLIEEGGSGMVDCGTFKIAYGVGPDGGNLGVGRAQQTLTYANGGFDHMTIWAAVFGVSLNNNNTELSIIHSWNRDLTTKSQIVCDYREILGQQQGNYANGYIAIGI